MIQPSNELTALAQLIATNSTADSYRFYIILAALGLVAAAGGAVVIGFFREQGKLIANSAAFQTTLNQLVQTTEKTETVRLQMGHSDWTEKELRTLRRTKLEELATAISRAKLMLETSITPEEVANFSERRSAEPMAFIEQVSALYFPELSVETAELLRTYVNYQQWRLSHQRAIGQAEIEFQGSQKMVTYFLEHPPNDGQLAANAVSDLQQKTQELGQRRREMTDQYSVQYYPFFNATRMLQGRAAELMTAIIKPVVYESKATDQAQRKA